MKKHLKIAGLASVMLTLLLVGVALAATVGVDTFDDGSQRVSISSGSLTDFVNGSPSVLGSERDIQVTYGSGSNFVSLSMDYNNSNVLNFSQDSGVSGTGLVQWDGTDGSITLQSGGLGSVDLTDSSTNDSLRLRITDNDNPVGITIRVYSNSGTNCSTLTYNSPGSINTIGALEDAIILFSDFTTICSGYSSLASFTTVSAIEMVLNGTLTIGADLTLDLFEATALRDFGDLPSSFTAATLAASHIPRSRRLGNSVDAEAANSTSNANGDDTSGIDDEGGVVPTPGELFKWSAANGGFVDIDVEGCAIATPCKVNGWIDWNQNGDFEAGERVINNITVTGDRIEEPIVVPFDPFNQSFYVRFRICPTTPLNACSSPTTTNVVDGEVEDYLWSFGPTAVTLTDLSARNTTSYAVAGLAGLLLLSGAYILLRRRKALAE